MKIKLVKILPIFLKKILKKIFFKFDNYFYKVKNYIFSISLIFYKEGINIGSGKKFNLLFWKNYDNFYGHNIDEKFKLNYKDNVFHLFFSSHFIEHINDKTFVNLSSEVFRVLKKGGIFRILTPNFDLLKKVYQEKDSNFIINIDSDFFIKGMPGWIEMGIKPTFNSWICHWFANYSNVPIFKHSTYKKFYILPPIIDDQVLFKKSLELSTEDFSKFILSHVPQEYKNNGGHINCFTFDKLVRILNKIGFDTYLSSYNDKDSDKKISKYYERLLNNLDKTHGRREISLYVNAFKK
jgi:SAM-dependent methyltransferase